VPFNFGMVTAYCAAACAIIYLLGYGARWCDAWLHRRRRPGDRVLVLTGMSVVVGAILGSLVQPWWTQGVACREAGEPLVPCLGRTMNTPDEDVIGRQQIR
jgi:hypothetical protein